MKNSSQNTSSGAKNAQKSTVLAKPDLYIIHGWTYTIDPWTRTLAELKKLGWTVKMLHVPGLTEPSEKSWTIDDYVTWAEESLPDGAVALGHSNGGRILLNLCAKNPGKLSHLILLDSAGIYEPSKRKKVVEELAKLGQPLKKVPLFSKVFHRLTGSTDYGNAPENMKITLRNMLESDKKLDFAKISTPVTILWGEKDTITPPRQGIKMHGLLKNSTLKIYPGWTHAPYISHPLELANVLDGTLKTLSERSRPVTSSTKDLQNPPISKRKAISGGQK